MEKSLGLIEVRGLSCAIEAADAMVKAANVVLDELESGPRQRHDDRQSQW